MSKKYTNPSGFPEYLPNILKQEMAIKDVMRKIYESYGYVPIETPSIEKLETLSSKGEISKEIYTISRALAEEEAVDNRALRFDLTVPFARYVAQYYDKISFPFKRWQIQKVWRGDRPQAGRFREFYQADIDVIGNENLPLFFDAEVVEIALNILDEIDFGAFTISINNRKFLQGLLEQFGASTQELLEESLKLIDKLEKIGREKVLDGLKSLEINNVEILMKIIENPVEIGEIDQFLEKLNFKNPLFIEGADELKEIFKLLKDLSPKNGKIVFNPKIARGLDYYTGSVYELKIDGYEKYGSICSGGRYENLAEKFTNKRLPGVGISIGLSRLMYILIEENLIDFNEGSVTQILIALLNEEQRLESNKVANLLRKEGKNVQVFSNASKNLAKQFKFADKINAKYVLLLNQKEGKNDGTFTLKNLETREEKAFENLKDMTSYLRRKN